MVVLVWPKLKPVLGVDPKPVEGVVAVWPNEKPPGFAAVVDVLPNEKPPGFAALLLLPKEKPPVAAGVVVLPNENPPLGFAAVLLPNEKDPLFDCPNLNPPESPPLPKPVVAAGFPNVDPPPPKIELVVVVDCPKGVAVVVPLVLKMDLF